MKTMQDAVNFENAKKEVRKKFLKEVAKIYSIPKVRFIDIRNILKGYNHILREVQCPNFYQLQIVDFKEKKQILNMMIKA